tara:strand:- start:125 stop:322 length:198 start_codon:yes stop_codon:yes gene_type:complete
VEELLRKLLSGPVQREKEGSKYLKDYQIECEECDEVSYVASYKEPKYCPICNNKIEAEEVEDVDI